MIGTAYAATAQAAAEHAGSGGMPQFESHIFSSQVTWSVISFVVLLILLRKYVFPAITHILDARIKQIEEDLSSAEKSRIEAEQSMARYREELSTASKNAALILDEARFEAARERDRLNYLLDEELTKKRGAALEEIEQAKRKALAELRDVVVDLTIQATERLITQTVSNSDAGAMVDDILRRMAADGQGQRATH